MQQGFAKEFLLKDMCLSPARDLKGVIPACTAVLQFPRWIISAWILELAMVKETAELMNQWTQEKEVVWGGLLQEL